MTVGVAVDSFLVLAAAVVVHPTPVAAAIVVAKPHSHFPPLSSVLPEQPVYVEPVYPAV